MEWTRLAHVQKAHFYIRVIVQQDARVSITLWDTSLCSSDPLVMCWSGKTLQGIVSYAHWTRKHWGGWFNYNKNEETSVTNDPMFRNYNYMQIAGSYNQM